MPLQSTVYTNSSDDETRTQEYARTFVYGRKNIVDNRRGEKSINAVR